MPSPRKDETENEFISRCVSDPEMIEKHPNQDQKIAICYSFWKNKPKAEENEVPTN